ncbi:carbohydrate ABC transporter permease [Halanaerobium sp. ST460_2HS_T2]|uniref:carbohydrate ABC transporter permease n=1 Tax=Halanaerobium sp. ST460_2HS_T2 TaxID=2183914 RepID=UPI000DF22178|nr:carbohydrate ABC transporter permease [Halanaerobium sp. ST460_2HS_T2]RCW62489.1 putative aldouronate transport system permease protein [Halanaerobium sp. ST460_2HS_T2]
MNNKKEKNGISSISKTTNFIFNVLLFILSISCIIPFLFVFIISITSEASIANFGYQFIPNEFSLEAYRFLWQEKDMILNSLGVSILITVVGTLLGLVLSTTMGYVLSRREYKLQSFFTWVVFIPMIFNGGMVASYVINANVLHLRNTLWALILPLMVSSFNVIICKTFFKTIVPNSIVESAKIDGANQLHIFTRIVLPIAKPLLATISLFLSFGFWNDWFLASLYITKQDLLPLQALLNNIQRNIEFLATNPSAGLTLQQYANQMPTEGVRMAIAVVIVVPIALAYPFFQKYFVSGLTIGAVKG